jgi:hypothetical protein
MPDLPHPTRRYDEQRTDAILRRAAELQASGGAAGSTDRGLTLPEMESLARDAGIDPALIRQAATEVELRTADRSAPFFGAPLRSTIERVVPGSMTDDAWGIVVAEAQSAFGPGHASQAGRTRTWSALGAGTEPSRRSVTISVTSRDDATVIRIDEAQNRLAGSLFGGLMGGLGGSGVGIAMAAGLGSMHSPALAAGLAFAVISGSYILARTIFTATVRRRSRQLHALLERILAGSRAAPVP